MPWRSFTLINKFCCYSKRRKLLGSHELIEFLNNKINFINLTGTALNTSSLILIVVTYPSVLLLVTLEGRIWPCSCWIPIKIPIKIYIMTPKYIMTQQRAKTRAHGKSKLEHQMSKSVWFYRAMTCEHIYSYIQEEEENETDMDRRKHIGLIPTFSFLLRLNSGTSWRPSVCGSGCSCL